MTTQNFHCELAETGSMLRSEVWSNMKCYCVHRVLSHQSKKHRSRVWRWAAVTSAYFISKSVIFFSPWQKEEKKKKSIYFPRQPRFDPLTYLWFLWLSSAAKRPHRISNWSSAEAKRHGVHVGSCFAQMPSGGISCDTPIQWSCGPTVRTWSHQQKTWEAIWM